MFRIARRTVFPFLTTSAKYDTTELLPTLCACFFQLHTSIGLNHTQHNINLDIHSAAQYDATYIQKLIIISRGTIVPSLFTLYSPFSLSSASAACSSAFSNFSSAPPPPPNFSTTVFTTSTVAAGPPGSAARTSPFFFTTKTPRCVPFGAFLRPMAAIKVAEGSQRSG